MGVDAENTKLPMGMDSFREICDGGYAYVDKTLLIKSLLDAPAKVTLFTRPRRFGKTLNMDMLRVFFEKTDEDTSQCFRDKKIWEEGPEYTDSQGQYPVIQLSFADTAGDTWDETLEMVTRILRREYKRHLNKMDQRVLGESDAGVMRAFITGEHSTMDLKLSLRDLSEILHGYYGVPPIILLDEYDTPIENAWESGSHDHCKSAVSFMRALLSPAFKGNKHLSFACLTGVLRVAGEGFFSGLNNLRVDGVLDRRYDEYFGFTPDEVRSLAESCGAEDKIGEITKWYQGYLFGTQKIFNPWSVVSYLDNGCTPKAYWANTTRNGALGEVLLQGSAPFLKQLTSLLGGGTVWSTINDSLLYPDLGAGARQENVPETVYTLLLMSGYLTITGKSITTGRDTQWELVIPNEELIAVYAREILYALPNRFELNQRLIIQQALLDGDRKVLEETLTDLLRSSVSFFDLDSEKEYQTWLLGLLSSMPGYRLTSNREAGEGRFDICLRPMVRHQPGVLIEVKVSKTKDATDQSMRKLAARGIFQMRKMQYAAELHAENVHSILEFGIAFNGKTAYAVTGDELDLKEAKKKEGE